MDTILNCDYIEPYGMLLPLEIITRKKNLSLMTKIICCLS